MDSKAILMKYKRLSCDLQLENEIGSKFFNVQRVTDEIRQTDCLQNSGKSSKVS